MVINRGVKKRGERFVWPVSEAPVPSKTCCVPPLIRPDSLCLCSIPETTQTTRPRISGVTIWLALLSRKQGGVTSTSLVDYARGTNHRGRIASHRAVLLKGCCCVVARADRVMRRIVIASDDESAVKNQRNNEACCAQRYVSEDENRHREFPQK